MQQPLTIIKKHSAYDANGNILKYKRNGYAASGSNKMDSLNYKYYPGTNKLKSVDDQVVSTNYTVDIDNKIHSITCTTKLATLLLTVAEGLRIAWTVYGKIDSIYNFKDTSAIKYRYDPAGQRIQRILQIKCRVNKNNFLCTRCTR